MAGRERSVSFDRVADQYDVTRGGAGRAVAMAGAVAPYLSGRTVLEAGVGTGIVAEQLRQRGVDPLGVDLSPAMLVRARERLGPRVAVADVQRLPVRADSVDAVLVVWVLHLVGDVGVAMNELVRVLRPGGRLVVVPSRPIRPDVDVERLHERLWRDLQPRGRGDDPERTLPLAAAGGLRLIHEGEVATEEYELSPAALAEVIRRRLFSVLFDVDDDTWQRVVEPIVAELEALPDPQRGRRIAHRHRLLVWEN